MLDFFARLFDATGFVRRQDTAGWTRELVWLHTGGDILIAVACLLMPVSVWYFARGRGVPVPRAAWLFGAFLILLAAAHFVIAAVFQTPVYRLAGVMKMAAGVAAWAAVIALFSALPKGVAWLDRARATAARRAVPEPETADDRLRDYIVAILAAVLAVLVRQLLNPLIDRDHAFVIPLLSVMFVAYRSGFGPAVLTLFLSMLGVVYLFVLPRQDTRFESISDQIATGMFLVCGVSAAVMGEAQRAGRRRTEQTLADLRTANEQLADSQRESAAALARLNAFIDNAPVGIAFFDEKLHAVKANQPLLQVGAAEAADGRTPRELFRDFPADVLAEIDQAVATNTPLANRLVETGTAADMKVWQLSVFPIRHEYGFSLGLGVIAKDATEQQLAERRVKESESRFRTLAEAMPQIVWTARPDGHREYYNARWYEYTGLSPAESLGEGWPAALHPDDAARGAARWRRSVETGEFYEIEYRFRRRDGAHRWFIGRATAVRDEAGRVVRWLGTCTDIDDFRKATDEARSNLERFRALTEAIPQLVWNADANRDATYFNTRWREYTGMAAVPASSFWWDHVTHPDDLPEMQAAWGRVTRGEPAAFETEIRVRRAADGLYRWFQAAVVPLRRPDGSVDQWIGSLSDIDDQKREAERLEGRVKEQTAVLQLTNETLRTEVAERLQAEEQVRTVALELRRSNDELEKFAYVASHDLQEPLRKIQAFGDRLATKFRDQVGDQGREYIDRMLASAGRMRTLINDLLAFSRVSSQGRAVARVDLGHELAEVLSDLEVRIAETGADVAAGPLPTVEADGLQMRQLFQNLIANALKFRTPDVPPRIAVSATRTADLPTDADPPPPTYDGVRITVADNGIGFEQTYADQIFEVFQRLHAKHEFEGTGIGLAVCRKIVERHAGAITARGTLGQGAVFIVDLPTVQPKTVKKDAP